MPTLRLDLETRSEADLSRVGLSRYARDPSTEILLCAWSLDDRTIQLWDLARGESMPPELHAALLDPAVTKIAHNAAFERQVLAWCVGIETPAAVWRCTMVWAYTLALPGSLAELGRVLGLPEDKAKLAEGRQLIRRFCQPAPSGPPFPVRFIGPQDDPAGWERFRRYCVRDVEAEREVEQRLSRWPVPDHEWELWALDQTINDTGLPVDDELVNGAIEVDATLRARFEARAIELSGVENPNSRVQTITWLGQQGVATEDLTRTTVRNLLQDSQDAAVAEMLRLRQQLSRTSVAKFGAFARGVDADGRIRHCFQFAGAGRTWRWSGRQVQPQNLGRPSIDDLDTARDLVRARDVDAIELLYDSPMEVLASLVRTAIAAPAGRVIVSCDYASIESVMLAWAAGCGYLLDLFRAGRDSYKDYATHLLGVAYDDVTKAQRQYAKPPTLGCGYMLGAAGLVRYAAGYGVDMDETAARRAVAVYRRVYPEIPQFWTRLDNAARACVMGGAPVRVGAFTFKWTPPFMRIELPSGRALSYLRPRIGPGFGAGRGNVLSYEGRDAAAGWGRVHTHPGKLTENIVQAIARDVLADGLRRVQALGLMIIGHVHDEILVECDAADGPRVLELMRETMAQPVPWCADAPLRATGYVSTYYTKD